MKINNKHYFNLLSTPLIVGAITIFLFSSCNSDNKAFTEKEYDIIDSLYNIRKKEYKKTLDSLCDSVYKAEFPIMIDSIKIVRKREILDLISS